MRLSSIARLIAVAAGLPVALSAQPVSVTVPPPSASVLRPVSAAFVLPGDEVELVLPPSRGKPALSPGGGSLEAAGSGRWRWKAPLRPGLYPIEVPAPGGGAAHVVNAFVQVPFKKLRGGKLNGYPIGHYPASKGSAYRRPEGFVEVTETNQDTWISPSFQLKQFLCKQSGGFPKYVVLKPALIHKLEALLSRARSAGYGWKTLFVMSGYRTPHYNRTLGNVKFSRHVYGDAADVFVDANGDGVMDDITGDGKTDIRDVYRLWDLARESGVVPAAAVGGLGTYAANAFHGPFLHVDTRGKPARWGVPRPAPASTPAKVMVASPST